MAGRLSRGMLQTDNKKYKQMTVPKLHQDVNQPKSYVTYPIKVDIHRSKVETYQLQSTNPQIFQGLISVENMSHEWRGPGVDILLDRLQPFAGRLMPWVVLMATSPIYNIMYDCGYSWGHNIIYTQVNVSMTFTIYIGFVIYYILYNYTIYSMYAVFYSSLHAHSEYHNLQIKMYILW